MGFTKFTGDLDIISRLDDNPNDAGMSAEELKAEFDKGSKLLKEYLNNTLLAELEGGLAAGKIGIDDISALGSAHNVQDGLEGLVEMIQDISQGAVADGSITTVKLADGAVTQAKLGELAITNAQMGAGAIKTENLFNGAVTNGKIADGAVFGNKLGEASVTETKLANAAVTNDKLAGGAVSTGKLADAAVTVLKLKDGSVTKPKLGEACVTSAKIEDGAVTLPKLNDEVLAYFADPVVIEERVVDNVSIAANSAVAAVIDDALDGYTPVGVVGLFINNASSSGSNADRVVTRGAYHWSSGMNIYLRNDTSTAAKVKVTARILYLKGGASAASLAEG